MADYSNVLSLENDTPQLTLYEETENISIEDSSVEYTVKKISVETSDDTYSKVKSVKATSPIDFNEENALVERLTSKSITKYDDLKGGISPIEVLQSSEPDFMANMYNIYILEVPEQYRDYPEQAYKTGVALGTYIGPETNTGRDYLGTNTSDLFSIIGMRTEGIEIPNKSLNTTDIKVAGQLVKKIVGNVNTPNKASFTVDLDQSMFILDAFHRLNGDWWAKEYNAYNALDIGLLKGNASESTSIEGKQFLLNFGTLPFHSSSSKKSIIDIIVEYDAAHQIISRYNNKLGSNDIIERGSASQISEVKDERFLLKRGRVQRYILHDCRFLGRSSSLTFQNSSAEPMKATFPFTFRRVLKVTDDGFIY
ncbi:MAG: hypothetical protein II304_05835 [Bacteroidales bacterium]|nr:hypothetical protein [Bacteroidales bacterium]